MDPLMTINGHDIMEASLFRPVREESGPSPIIEEETALLGVCYSIILGCTISQHVDAKQLSSPTKQSQAMTNHNRFNKGDVWLNNQTS